MSQTDARLWENKCIHRLSAVRCERWLNKGNWGYKTSIGRPLGFKESEETKRKKSDALKGRSNLSAKGRLVSDKTRKRISESTKGKNGKFQRTDEMRRAHSERMLGKVRTDEMKENYKRGALQRSKKKCLIENLLCQ